RRGAVGAGPAAGGGGLLEPLERDRVRVDLAGLHGAPGGRRGGGRLAAGERARETVRERSGGVAQPGTEGRRTLQLAATAVSARRCGGEQDARHHGERNGKAELPQKGHLQNGFPSPAGTVPDGYV